MYSSDLDAQSWKGLEGWSREADRGRVVRFSRGGMGEENSAHLMGARNCTFSGGRWPSLNPYRLARLAGSFVSSDKADTNTCLRPPSSDKVINGISCLQGGGRKCPQGGRIARIVSNGDWVHSGWIRRWRSRFLSYQSCSHQHRMNICTTLFSKGVAGMVLQG